jgi:hypothetical protein
MMKNIYIGLILCLCCTSGCAQKDQENRNIHIEGNQLIVEGSAFIINGMNWNYRPIGYNYEYNLWSQSDVKIKSVLDKEMSMLQDIGVNSVRIYTGIQPKWIEYIYRKYGIYTMINYSFGRYGLQIEGKTVSPIHYDDKATQHVLLKEVHEMVELYNATPGLLLYLLGNENNYGLFWKGSETEDLPKEEDIPTERVIHLYKAFNLGCELIKSIDPTLPVAICNGDLQYIDIITEECKSADILGINTYRGVSFEDLFAKAKSSWNKPILLTEFGADAFNVVKQKEDQNTQAKYLLGNWKEIYQNADGLGKSNNCIGGYTFHFSDGWWKTGQTKNLDKHDSTASWENGGYSEDFIKGQNNMNEEWFGICAKELADSSGSYTLIPRKAYYTLREIHKISPYQANQTIEKLNTYFSNIDLRDDLQNAPNSKIISN